jgi:hypothetical protein
MLTYETHPFTVSHTLTHTTQVKVHPTLPNYKRIKRCKQGPKKRREEKLKGISL